MRLKSHAMNVAAGIGVGLILMIILMRTFENRLIFSPPRFPIGFSSPQDYSLRLEEIWLTASDGVRLNANFLPAPESSKVLLWFHGNAENIGMGLDHLKSLEPLGINILAVDYRGYGKSDGSPDEHGVYRDAEAAYRWLTEERRFEPRNIFVYGHSLGGAVAVDLASRFPCGGLIVESSFTSIPDMARRIYRIPFLQYLPRSRFDSLAKIKKVSSPVLIIHGKQDQVVPFEMGRRLYEAAREPKTFLPIEDAAHDDPYVVGGERYDDALREFLGIAASA